MNLPYYSILNQSQYIAGLIIYPSPKINNNILLLVYQKSLKILLQPIFLIKNTLLLFKQIRHILKTVFIFEKQGLIGILKIIGVENYLPIRFGTTLNCITISNVRNATPVKI